MAYRTLVLLVLALALPCEAQTIYKIIGQDGRVTYTDRPPPAASSQVAALPGTQAAGERNPRTSEFWQLVEAAEKVYLKQHIVHVGQAFCTRFAEQAPQASGAAKAAEDAAYAARVWQFRHSILMADKVRIFHHLLTLAENEKHGADTRGQIDAFADSLERGSARERLARCRQMPAMFASPGFDLAGDPVLVAKITGFDPSNKPVRPRGPRH